MRFHPAKVRFNVSVFGTSAGFWMMMGSVVTAGYFIALLIIYFLHSIFH